MSLSYDKSKNQDGSNDSMWTTYSDLFMMLAVLFLMLYVIANLRSTTASLQSRVEYQNLVAETEDYKQQNKVYEALKSDYLAGQADEKEVKVYEDLMEKLSLLRTKAQEEKEALRKQADDNEAKELALNHYQQIVRNIINANVVAKAKLVSRDEVIERKRQEIDEKEQIISQNSEEIREIRENLVKKVEQLKKNEKSRKISKAKMDQEIAQLRSNSEQKIAELKSQSEVAETQLAEVSKELTQTKTKLETTATKLDQETVEKAKLGAQLAASKAQFEDEMEQLKSEYDQKAAADKAAFQQEIDSTKLSAAERAGKEKAYAEQLKNDKAELANKLASLGDKMQKAESDLAATQQNLQAAEKANDQYKQYVAALQQQKKDLSGDLAAAKQQLKDRRDIAERIKKDLAKAGVKAEVDTKTGEVVIAFGKEYFDTGRADLKPNMIKTLKEFIPHYSKSLFKDPKISEKIASIDLIGFASPTYAGKYVDPQSLKETDREAVQYNLDLSYQRARSIFNYVFDTKKMKFENQQRLLGMVKVSGRSFLHEAVKGRDIESGISVKEFCAKFDCLTEQKVIIKFHLKD
jgi:outer membrane protein OmpA-like peptidoglycan-associated protein